MLKIFLEVVIYLFLYATDKVICKTNATLARYSEPPAVLQTQYAKAFVTKSLRCGQNHDDLLKLSSQNGFTSLFSTLYDHLEYAPKRNLVGPGTSHDVTAGFTEQTDVHFKKVCEHCCSLKKLRRRRRNYPMTVNLVETGGKARTTTALLTINDSAMTQAGYNPQSIRMPATLSTNGFNAPMESQLSFARCSGRYYIVRHSALLFRITSVRNIICATSTEPEEPVRKIEEKFWISAGSCAKSSTGIRAHSGSNLAE